MWPFSSIILGPPHPRNAVASAPRRTLLALYFQSEAREAEGRDLDKKHSIETGPWKNPLIWITHPVMSPCFSPQLTPLSELASVTLALWVLPLPILSVVAPIEAGKRPRRGLLKENDPPGKATSISRCPSKVRSQSYQLAVSSSMSTNISKGLSLKTLETSQKSSSCQTIIISSNCL